MKHLIRQLARSSNGYNMLRLIQSIFTKSLICLHKQHYKKKPPVRLKTTSTISSLAKTKQNINCYLLERPSQTTIALFKYTGKVIHDTVYPP